MAFFLVNIRQIHEKMKKKMKKRLVLLNTDAATRESKPWAKLCFPACLHWGKEEWSIEERGMHWRDFSPPPAAQSAHSVNIL